MWCRCPGRIVAAMAKRGARLFGFYLMYLEECRQAGDREERVKKVRRTRRSLRNGEQNSRSLRYVLVAIFCPFGVEIAVRRQIMDVFEVCMV